jgi:LmbE family N-acetylglucosaminyl deacetylase
MLRHVYLSPHLDDAVLSCGGLICRQSRRGDEVIVMTICAGPAPAAPSDFARLLHARWLADATETDPMALRRREDEAACAFLGVRPLHLALHDGIYRRDAGGRWLYAEETALWGPPDPADDPTVWQVELEAWLERLQPDFVYAPLAVGNHVDHQLTRQVAERWVAVGRPVLFYEDFPYSESSTALWFSLNRRPEWAWARRIWRLESEEVEAKVAALACYRSQMAVLFPNDGLRPRVLAQLARTGAPAWAEALWQPLPLPSAPLRFPP